MGFESAVIDTDPANAANRVLRVSSASTYPQGAGAYGILSSSEQIAQGATKTLFLRFHASSNTTNQSFGLTPVDTPMSGGSGNWGDFSVQIGLINGNLGARDGDTMRTLTAITPGTWYNLWVVVNNAANTFSVYLNQGSADATEANRMKSGTIETFAFRNGTTEALDRFLWRAQPQTTNPAIRVDDIYISDGTVLSYPSPVFTAHNLLVNGDLETGGSGAFTDSPYPSSWAGSGQKGAHHSEAGYRKGEKGVVFWSSDTRIYQDFAAVAGRAYTISAEVITPSSDPIKVWDGRISVEWYNASRNMIRTDVVGILTEADPVDAWKSAANTFFAPAHSRLGRVVLTLGGTLVPDGQGGYLNSGKVYFDDVVVRVHHPDYTNDGLVDFYDFARLAATWLASSPMTDLTGDSSLGAEDLICFSENWLQPISKYELVWGDEFNGTVINLNNWEHQNISGQASGNNELQHYTSASKNSRVENGTLIIEAIKDGYWSSSEQRWYAYTSARLRTRGKHEFTYGYIEARIKIPSTQGIWPAFWMMPTDSEYGGWAGSGEIDIMESINQADTIYGTIHYGGSYPQNVNSGGNYSDGTDFSEDFHIYTIVWEPTRIRWYIDGILYSTKTWWYTADHPYPAPFDKRFYLLLNVAVGGNWPGYPDETSVFPQRMVVDYVRVYKEAK